MAQSGHPQALLQDAVDHFDGLIGHLGQHGVIAGGETYIQPPVCLSFHLVQMRAAGWSDVDFDDLAAVSGASALFGFQPGDFGPKYANLWIGMDQRIADALGFGYEWVDFQGTEGAWKTIRENVDAGRSLKGWDWENILFAGYRDADKAEEREVFAMSDGPDTYAKWLTWEAFSEWVNRVEEWKCPRLGRHSERVQSKPAKEVALRVMRDLVAWSSDPPAVVREKYPKATFGLAGVEAYAAHCENVEAYESVVACHEINGQWTIRNSTSVYLGRVVEAAVFSEAANALVSAAARQYRAAYESWQELYALLGHDATEAEHKDRERRLAGAAAVRRGLEHEEAALAEVEKALALLA